MHKPSSHISSTVLSTAVHTSSCLRQAHNSTITNTECSKQLQHFWPTFKRHSLRNPHIT